METLNANELYFTHKKLITYLCYKYYVTHKERCERAGIELEDLTQEAYFSVVDSVNAYDETKGYRITAYFEYALLNRLNSLSGNRGHSRSNVLNNSISLDAPIKSDDETTLGELIPDNSSENDFESVIEAEYITAIRKDIYKALSQLPTLEGQAIYHKYIKAQTASKASEEMCIDIKQFKKLLKSGMKHLRQNEFILKYRDDFIYTKGMTNTGRGYFNRTWTSATEKTAILLQNKRFIF